jgi:uncharacterized membrane protein
MLTIVALMAALSNVLSVEPFVLPVVLGPFTTRIHFSQLPILIAGILGGPWAGLLTGAVGGVYMSFTVIPFILGGLALLGFSAGLFAKRLKSRPFFSCILAWCVQAPYVLVTDYLWFASSRLLPQSVAWTTVSTILVLLTVEAVIASVLAEILIIAVKRAGINLS